MEKLLTVDEDVVENVARFFGKTLRQLDDDVLLLKEWTKSQHHFPEIPDDNTLRNFLILNKLSVEKSKQKLDNYYTVKSTTLKEIYDGHNPKLANIKRVMDMLYFLPHYQLTPQMYRVIFFKVRDKAAIDDVVPEDTLRHLVNIMELRLKGDVMFGDVYICDCKDVTFGYITKLTPTLFYNFFVVIYQHVFSFRLKALYLVNLPSFGEVVLKILKKLLKPKMLQRVHTVSHYDFLKDYCSDDHLPSDFGGRGVSLEELQETMKRTFVENQELFDRLDTLRVDESLRPARLENDETLGFHGNFKKLDVD